MLHAPSQSKLSIAGSAASGSVPEALLLRREGGRVPLPLGPGCRARGEVGLGWGAGAGAMAPPLLEIVSRPAGRARRGRLTHAVNSLVRAHRPVGAGEGRGGEGDRR